MYKLWHQTIYSHYVSFFFIDFNLLRPSYAYKRLQTNHHWFRYWLVALSAPNHYLNQCWNAVIGSLGTRFRDIFIEMDTFSFTKNAFENVVREVAAVGSRSHGIKDKMQFQGFKVSMEITITYAYMRPWMLPFVDISVCVLRCWRLCIMRVIDTLFLSLYILRLF